MSSHPLKSLVLPALLISGVAFSQPLSIATTSLPVATVGIAYQATLQAAGGESPYTWSVVSLPWDGSLPEGLTLNASTGVISGIPTVPDAVLPPGTVPLGHPLRPPLVFQVSDSTGATATTTLPIHVLAARR